VTLRVLSLASLFPDQTRPVFGSFVERQCLALAARADVEMRIVAPIGIPPWPLSLHPRYRVFDGVPAQENWKGLSVFRPRFWHIPLTSGRFDARLMARALLPLCREIQRDFPFDMIDAGFFFPDGVAAVALGKALGVPVSIKARGSDIQIWGRAAATGQQIIAAGKSAELLLAVSAALKQDMVALGMPEDRILVHYTGVDQTAYHPIDRIAAKAARGIKGPLIASVGTLNANKGHAITIAALPKLPDAQLVVIGKGEALTALEAQAAELGVTDRVTFTGPLPGAEVSHWLATADVMALPSASEGLANAWVEALACGTPVVACDVGGAREVIHDGISGRLVARTPEGVAAGISDLLANPVDPAHVRATITDFTWEANSAALVEAFSALAAHRLDPAEPS
jgi:teichuronic acid biosynthesis glycosyltransferase TuaC